MFHRLKIVPVFLLVVAFGFLTDAVPAAAAKTSKLKATVYTVNGTGSSITLQAGGGSFTTLNVTPGTKITRNRKNVSLTSLVSGDKVTAAFDSSLNATQLTASGPAISTFQGNVLGVNSATGMVHLSSGNIHTNAKTRVLRNGQLTSLSALTLQDTATAHVSSSQAIDIEASGPEGSEVHGTITGVVVVDPVLGTGTVSIVDANGNPFTFNVTVDTMIEVDDQAGTIGALVVGMFVEIHYDPLTNNAFRIDAEDEEESAEIEGTISAIDLIAGTITILNSADGVSLVTLTVNAATKIEKNDAPVLITDLVVGDQVSAEYSATTLLAHEIEVETEDDDDGDGNED